MNLTTYFISGTKHISESTFKINAMPPGPIFKILLTPAVICNQRLLQENKIVQCFEKYQNQDVNEDHFKKPLQSSTNVMKNNYPETAHNFFPCCSIFSYFLHSNCSTFALLSENQLN